MPPRTARGPSLALLLILASPDAGAEEPEQDIESVAKQVQNPIAGVVVLQFENNINYLIGPHERTQNVLNLQPILPLRLHENLFLISILRLPFVWSPDVRAPTGGASGLGDITLQPLVSGRLKRGFFWGIGPVLRFPTGTDKRLGPFDTGQFSVGPAASVAVTPGHFVIAVLAHNAWSVAGRESGRPVNSLFVQPIIDYNLPDGWYLTVAPTIICDWTASRGCIVPVGGGVGRVGQSTRTRVAFDLEVQAYWNAVRPDPGPPWTLRFQLSLFLPKPPPAPGRR